MRGITLSLGLAVCQTRRQDNNDFSEERLVYRLFRPYAGISVVGLPEEMNAITLYTSTCRYILQADHERPETWADLYRLLPYLRQALSCCVCANLLSEPWGPTNSICQHQVCRSCIGGKMRLKPSCSWCKDYSQFKENKELRIILACYKRLCIYVAATPIAEKIENSSDNGGPNTTIDILQEGMSIADSYEGSDLCNESSALQFLLPTLYSHFNRKDANSTIGTSANGKAECFNPEVGISPSTSFQFVQGPSHSSAPLTNGSCFSKRRRLSGRDNMNASSLSFRGSKSKVKRKHRSMKHKKRKHKSSRRHREEKRKRRSRRAKGENTDGTRKEKQLDVKRLVVSGHRAKMLKEGKTVPELAFCRCGTNGTSPGTFPCISQRCPCFVLEKSCANCKCRSCHNPLAKQELVNSADEIPSGQVDGTKSEEVKKETNVSDSDSYVDVTGTTNS